MADLGTINSSYDNFVEDEVQPPSAITTTILNSVIAVAEAVISTEEPTKPYITKGDTTPASLLASDKGNQFPYNRVSPTVVTIDTIVPGPIANIEAGIEIGYTRFQSEIPRVFPPIFTKREDI